MQELVCIPKGTGSVFPPKWPVEVSRAPLVKKALLSVQQLSSILFGDTMVPNIDQDDIHFLGNSMLYTEYYLTRFNHKKKHCSVRYVQLLVTS